MYENFFYLDYYFILITVNDNAFVVFRCTADFHADSPTMAATRIAPGVGANLIGQHAQERNQEATVYVGNLDFQV